MNPKLKIEFLVSPDFDRELSNWYSTIFKKSFMDTRGARSRYCDCCILVYPNHVFDFLGLIRFIILGNAQRIQPNKAGAGDGSALRSEESTASVLKISIISFIGIHDRLHGDLIYAQNEIAYIQVSR